MDVDFVWFIPIYYFIVVWGKKALRAPSFLAELFSERERKKENTLKTKIMEETEIQSILLHSETAAALMCPRWQMVFFIFSLWNLEMMKTLKVDLVKMGKSNKSIQAVISGSHWAVGQSHLLGNLQLSEPFLW